MSRAGRFVYDVWTYQQEKDYGDSMCRVIWSATEIQRISLSRRAAKREFKKLDEFARKNSDGIGYAFVTKRWQPENWNFQINAYADPPQRCIRMRTRPT